MRIGIPGSLRTAYVFGGRFIDYRMGVMGGVVMGCIVFGINYDDTYDWHGALTASLKQGGYTFLFGGIIMRSCETLAVRIRTRSVALAAAVIIPSAVSILFTFGIHSMKGTPKPLESTIPTAILVIPSTAVWGFGKRKRSLHYDTSKPST
jgi:hypothetical protein